MFKSLITMMCDAGKDRFFWGGGVGNFFLLKRGATGLISLRNTALEHQGLILLGSNNHSFF